MRGESRRIYSADKDYRYIGFFLGHVKDSSKYIESVKDLEREGIFVQNFPCEYLLCEELLTIAANIAIRDFKLGENRAKKISTEFLLRLTGLSQIKEAFERFFDKEEFVAYFVVFSLKKVNLELEYVKEKIRGVDLREEKCEKNLNAIMKKYRVTENEIKSISRPYLSNFEILKRVIIERIAYSIHK